MFVPRSHWVFSSLAITSAKTNSEKNWRIMACMSFLSGEIKLSSEMWFDFKLLRSFPIQQVFFFESLLLIRHLGNKRQL